ncbi:hypothetical protein WR25_12823 [Diploscapter pachys]|uniref:Uncharacterized protein n=1 Tax=Diploscapter pachys TaxID=2018661 RepID=A0A2A2JB28_9BILA|nr:hypothetical protein WR25_12823 [Diploscapter pachys]
MDLEALIEALQMGENINSGVDLKWGGYKVIDGGKGGAGPNRKPRGELPPALQKKDPPPKPPTELTDDYILDEIRKFKKEHPTKESLDETFQNDPRFWQYNRRFAEGMNSESPDSGNATNGMPNDNAARPKTEGGVRPRPSFKYNRYVTRDA